MLSVATHIFSGSIAILAGALVLLFAKGGRVHRQLGKVFLIAMLVMGLTGTYVALERNITLSLLNGLLVCYFVLTSYLVIKKPDNTTSAADTAMLVMIVILAASLLFIGIDLYRNPGTTFDGFGAEVFFFFGAVATFCALGDMRHLFSGGTSGNRRIVRHLWRMFFPFFMAVAAFFLGQASLFPESLRKIEYLAAPVLVVVVCMLFWVFRVRFAKSAFA